MTGYSKVLSSAKLESKSFKAHVSDDKLNLFSQLIKLSPIGPAVFENTNAGRRYGMRRDWLTDAKKHWETTFDWRKCEDRINSFPNFTVSVTDDEGLDINVHFLALFSEKPDAVPIAFCHGWPGSFLEFLQILDILKVKYSPKNLPCHVIVPSLPGYAFSSGPPLDRAYSIEQAANCLDKLMIGLGFETGYLAQGGDLGSSLSRYLAVNQEACKGMHVNTIFMAPPGNAEELQIDEVEKTALPREKEFRETGFAYAMENGTRTATIGLALQASPLAMLSWIGEKFLEWSDEDPSLDEILMSVSLYWLTDTYQRCIYPYRGQGGPAEKPFNMETNPNKQYLLSYLLRLE